jgi:spermidine synthase
LFIFSFGGKATTWLEDGLYEDNVLVAETSHYQRIIVTRWKDDTRLFLNGHLQFSTSDEYRYHEALVLPSMGAVKKAQDILVLGGGDGLVVRQLRKHDSLRSVDLVDLDPAITELFSEHAILSEISGDALEDERVTIHHMDAVKYLEASEKSYDVIIMDLPDPNDPALSRLYTKGVFRLALRHLRPRGALVTQATSPFYAPDAYWCIVETIEAAVKTGPLLRAVHPYHAFVPSFGEWGFVMVTAQGVKADESPIEVDTRFLNADSMASMFRFPKDIARREVEVNRLSSAILARYYNKGWRQHHSD